MSYCGSQIGYLKHLHNLSFRNKTNVKMSSECGCFHCLEIFNADKVVSFTEKDDTAICPKCGIDSILSSNCVMITSEILIKMNERWFKTGQPG